MSKTALIVVDIQNDYFLSGKWPLVGVEAAADQAARAIADARAHGDLVVHIRHEFVDDNAPFFAAGSEGAQIHPKVASLPGEPVVLKNYVNSFRKTELKQVLDAQGIDSLVVVGNMSHMCIDAVTRQANDYGYAVTVLHDACATRNLEFDGVKTPAAQVHAACMAALGFAYAKVISTDDYLATRTAKRVF